MQKSVTLCTTEAEYVAMADEGEEALDVREVLVFLTPILGSPGIGVFGYNRGAKDLAKVTLSSSNSKRNDARCPFLRELVGTRDFSDRYLRAEDKHADNPHEGYWQRDF